MKFRKKPVVIEAIQYTGDNLAAILAYDERIQWSDSLGLGIGTPEGMMTANRGDWIIKGVAGEVYPCKPGIFDATYERVYDMGDADIPDGAAMNIGVTYAEHKPTIFLGDFDDMNFGDWDETT